MKKLLPLLLMIMLLLTACATDEQTPAPPQAPPPTQTQRADGTQIVTTYHANGTLATETRTYPDGEQGIEHYAEDGTLSALIRHLPDGSYNEEQYADGSIKSSERSLGGRLVQAEYYDAAGRLTESFGLDNYGRPVRRTHHADGSETSRISNPDGSTTQVEHDAAGNVLSSAIVE